MILNAPDADEQLRDLARLVSERGVVFFKAQDLQIADQLKLADRLGKLSGKPESSGLHIHPISESTPEFGPEVSVISSMGAYLPLPLDMQCEVRAWLTRGWCVQAGSRVRTSWTGSVRARAGTRTSRSKRSPRTTP